MRVGVGLCDWDELDGVDVLCFSEDMVVGFWRRGSNLDQVGLIYLLGFLGMPDGSPGYYYVFILASKEIMYR